MHSLIKQQKIVISMLSAFVPKYAQQMVQNVGQGKIGGVEIENNAIVQSRANENVLVFGKERENTAHQSLISFGASRNLVKNQECNIDTGNSVPSSNSCLWSLMAVDDNHEQGELAYQHSSMQFEDLMTPTEQWGYLPEFMSKMEFQETRAEIETKPALLLVDYHLLTLV